MLMISLRCMENNSCPSTLPWGTPYSTLSTEFVLFGHIVCYSLSSVLKLFTHCHEFHTTLAFAVNCCDQQALIKSKKIPATPLCPWYNPLQMKLIIFTTASSVPQPFLNS